MYVPSYSNRSVGTPHPNSLRNWVRECNTYWTAIRTEFYHHSTIASLNQLNMPLSNSEIEAAIAEVSAAMDLDPIL